MTKGILRMTLKTVIAGSAFVLACGIAFAVGQAQQKTSTLTPADKLEIQELLARYMFVLDSCPDHNNGYDYADLYTEDGAFGNNKGREALARAAGRTSDGNCNANRQRGENNELHINVAPIIVPTPEGARGTSYLMMIQGPANQIYFAGWYEDTYVKTAKGWRFKTRDHVSGLRAGIPANAGAIRNEMTRLAKDNLAKNPPTTANTGGRGPATPPPPPHDPLNWVDGKVKQVAAR
jgi:hypothetical protein